MNFGLVGHGLIGKKRAQAIAEKNENLSFIIDPECPKKENFFKDLKDLPNSELQDLDGVIISIPHFLTLEYIKFFSKYTNHILVEKPLGLSLLECKEIIDIEKTRKLQIRTGFNYRYLRNIEKLKELIDEGFFGEIFEVDMRLEHGGRPGMENEWKLKRSKAGGGVVIDPGIHLFDLINYLFGSNIKVDFFSYSTKFWDVDVEDSFNSSLIVNNTRANISVNLYSWINNFNIKVYGSDGYAFLSGRGGNYGSLKIEACKRWFWQTNEEVISHDYGLEDDSLIRETHDFIDGSNKNKISNTTDSLNAMKIVDKIYGK